MSATLTTGQQLHGFTVTVVTPLPELSATLIQLRHDRTGARYAHIDCSDDNNLFAVAFRTPPDDSTGVAHILEHTVLCGSQRYPVRDPFFSMLKRSLNTFMNAMTASDWTLYPFASRNPKDFANLRDIYLDAAFFPLLRERDFRQEGHRLEFATQDDPTTPLTIKGVVYNEMKGALASPASLLPRRLAHFLYPSTTYRHNSGGDPAEIPQLTVAGLRDFHARHYHPSNAWFYSYGTFPLSEHLAVVEEQVLRHFERQPESGSVPPESRRETPQAVQETYPVDPGEVLEGKSLVQVGWLTGEITDSYERLGMTVLSSLLLGTPAAPLYQALLDSRLGSNLAPGTGYHDDNRTTCFAVGLQGSEPERAEAIEALILATLEKIAQRGFAAERIEAVLHRLELAHKEVTGNHYPYPLALLMRMIGPWLHGDDPVSPLLLDANLARLRRDLAAGPYFSDLLRRRLLDNRHRVRLTLVPDPQQQEREEAEVNAQLARQLAALDPHQRQEIVTAAQELQASQEAEEDLSCLPTLGREDIPAVEEIVVATAASSGGRPVDWFDQPTNGIGYLIAHFDSAAIPPELLPTLPLFCALLTQVGAAGLTYQAMAERMEAATGGIQAGVETLEDPYQPGRFIAPVELRGKALVRNQQPFYAILGDLCTAADFSDRERLATVLGQLRTSMENSIPGSGHSYAARAAASSLTPAAGRRELWAGLEQFRLVRTLAEKPAAELDAFAGELQHLARLLLASPSGLAVTAEKQTHAALTPGLTTFLAQLSPGAMPPATLAPPFVAAKRRRGFATSVPVAYVARVFPAVPYTHADAAPLAILARLLRAGYLHREIREKGGAYGGLAGYNPEGGLLSLLSYRDPHIARTLRVYDEAAAWAAGGNFSDEELTQALLAVFGDLDRPLSPGGRGNREFANRQQGLTPALRQAFREQLLAATRADLLRVAERYLLAGRNKSCVAVIAGEEMLRKANEELGEDGLEIERI
ncbi:MAG: peptidase M16 [Desulfuromonadales bacterium GWC2_61_20]|nr:MAG: peptidase M16 [Desulfuromonadales bacterium GWC2_61_20]